MAKQRTGRGSVGLIDECAKPLLDVMGTAQEEVNRNALKAFYSTFKAAKHTIVFLTGVTKFAQVGGFNQPRDISMDARFETICGITEEELYRYFPEQIKALAEAEGSSEAEIKKRLRSHYDGYHFSRRMTGVYNPFSILNALDSGELRDFLVQHGDSDLLDSPHGKLEREHGRALGHGLHRGEGRGLPRHHGAAAPDALPERLPHHQELRQAQALLYKTAPIAVKARPSRTRQKRGGIECHPFCRPEPLAYALARYSTIASWMVWNT